MKIDCFCRRSRNCLAALALWPQLLFRERGKKLLFSDNIELFMMITGDIMVCGSINL
jgi:hypothetical protein